MPAEGHKGVKEARFDLIPMDALWYVARVFGKGAEKYAERNWERGLKWGASKGALDRHLALFWAGQDKDEESGLPHLAHVAWHGLVLLAMYLRGSGEDDRSPHEALDLMKAEVTNPEDIEAARAEVEGRPTVFAPAGALKPIEDFVFTTGGLPCDALSPDDWCCERVKGHTGPHACPAGNCAEQELRW